MKKVQIRFRLGIAALAAVLLSGCQSAIFNNFVDEQVPQNASNIYTFSFAADLPFGNLVKNTVVAKLVIGEEEFVMSPSPENPFIFTHDYRLPAGVSEVRYYYILEYDYINQGSRGSTKRFSTHENYGRPFIARLINRYPIQIISSRGFVGDKIPVVGTGFSALDRVMVGGVPSETTFYSPQSLDFRVPPLDPGHIYDVVLQTSQGPLQMGSFRVDAGELTVSPASVRVASGDVTQLVFRINGVAPAGGIPVRVTTDAPAVVILPEVTIPAGFSSTVVTLEGGERGQTTLTVQMQGYPAQIVRVTVD